MNTRDFSCEIGGKTITATFSDLADQANGSIIVKCGNTAVLATAVMSKEEKEGLDYFPLVVDYEEKFYAAGLVLGGRFMRREGKPSEEAILSGRMVDRTIRPLFNQTLRNEVQVIITILSIDEENDPDILAIFAASIALSASDIPWDGPIGTLRIGKKTKDAPFVINPTYAERDEAYLDLVVCGQDGHINMIEAGGKEVSENHIQEALSLALPEIAKEITFQKKLVEKEGKVKKDIPKRGTAPEIEKLFNEKIGDDRLSRSIFESDGGKNGIASVSSLWEKTISETIPEHINDARAFLERKIDACVHTEALKNGRRADGRGFDEIRPLFASAGGISDTLHGAGIFFRGGTHVLSVLTLGGPQDTLLIEGMETRATKHFMHHYNFPPFSSGETGRLGNTNRRSIGHGALAEKALRAIIPPKEVFPYTIRLVSECMASNGSTSMASVCASSLALFDGGVPVEKHIAGIAMGLMSEKDQYKILTDIQGPEDHFGDMDFKVAGTRDGITALQLDIKISGISHSILSEALTKARDARMKIISLLEETVPKPRPNLKETAPRVEIVKIDVEKIGLLIGPGGKTVRSITDETGASIDIDQEGEVVITGKKDAVEKAKEIVSAMVREYKEGDRLDGIVTRIFPFGAMVKIGPGAEGLVHISELAPHRVNEVTDVVCPGETVPVVVKEKDEKGRINLSITKADPEFANRRGKKDCGDISAYTPSRYNGGNGRERRNQKH